VWFHPPFRLSGFVTGHSYAATAALVACQPASNFVEARGAEEGFQTGPRHVLPDCLPLTFHDSFFNHTATMESQERVAIIGSGLAGLVSAHLLHGDQKQRYAVKVFESVRYFLRD
jgi:hypothetical protein